MTNTDLSIVAALLVGMVGAAYVVGRRARGVRAGGDVTEKKALADAPAPTDDADAADAADLQPETDNAGELGVTKMAGKFDLEAAMKARAAAPPPGSPTKKA